MKLLFLFYSTSVKQSYKDTNAEEFFIIFWLAFSNLLGIKFLCHF